jgi:hypothetical protein
MQKKRPAWTLAAEHRKDRRKEKSQKTQKKKSSHDIRYGTLCKLNRLSSSWLWLLRVVLLLLRTHLWFLGHGPFSFYSVLSAGERDQGSSPSALLGFSLVLGTLAFHNHRSRLNEPFLPLVVLKKQT